MHCVSAPPNALTTERQVHCIVVLSQPSDAGDRFSQRLLLYTALIDVYDVAVLKHLLYLLLHVTRRPAQHHVLPCLKAHSVLDRCFQLFNIS